MHLTPPLGGPRWNITIPFNTENNYRMVELPDGENPLGICINVCTQYRRVTDRQTSCHGIVRAMHTRREVKKFRAYHLLFWSTLYRPHVITHSG